MADANAGVEWDDYAHEGGEPHAGTFSTIMSFLGAVISLALIAGLVVWAWQLVVRDVSGVPVVQAIEGPMRVQPEDPGGEAAAHQGLAVNAVQEDGGAAAPAERLVLAPAPVELEDEDAPGLAGVAVLQEPREPVAENDEPSLAETADATAVAVALALADEIAGDAEPLEGEVARAAETPATAPVALADEEDEGELRLVPISVGGLTSSPRPVPRPADRPVQVASASATGPVPAPYEEVDPATLAVGTRLVQLGAFESEEIARQEWDKLAARFQDHFYEKKRVVQKASSSGKTFYRLRAMGFDDLSDARRFCSTLMAGKAACIPVVTR